MKPTKKPKKIRLSFTRTDWRRIAQSVENEAKQFRGPYSRIWIELVRKVKGAAREN